MLHWTVDGSWRPQFQLLSWIQAQTEVMLVLEICWLGRLDRHLHHVLWCCTGESECWHADGSWRPQVQLFSWIQAQAEVMLVLEICRLGRLDRLNQLLV